MVRRWLRFLLFAVAFGFMTSAVAGLNYLNSNGEFKKTITVAANEEFCIWIDQLDPSKMYWWVDIEGKNADGDIIWAGDKYEDCKEDGTTTAIYAFFSKDDWGMSDGISGTYTFTVTVTGDPEAPFSLNRGGRSDYKGYLWDDDPKAGFEDRLPSFGDGMQSGDFYEESYGVGSGESLTLKGLPAGLSVTTVKRCCGLGYEYRISGTLTKPGVYTVEATLTRADKSTDRAKKLVVIGDGGSFYPTVSFDSERGTVTGLGVFSAGSSVKLTAKPAKGFVFAGWTGGPADSLDWFEQMNPALTYVGSSHSGEIFANFILPQEDYLFVGVNELALALNEPVEFSFWDQFSVDSGSTPTVTIAGLPTGLKYDAKTRLVAGKPTKEGIFFVTISAKNAGGFTHSAVARWTVGYPEDPYFDEIGLPSCGDGMQTGEFYEDSYWVGPGETLTLKGLPAGLAVTTIKQCCGLGSEYRISGTLTKPGVYTVEATLTREDKSTSRAKKLVTVYDGGSFYPAVRCEPERGTVSGLGVVSAGSAVKLTAKPAKGYVFAGWSGGAADSLDYFDRMDPNLAYAADFRWSEISANFILPQEDHLSVGVAGLDLTLDEPVEFSFWDQFSVDSGSTPTVTIAGLPTGLKYDAKTRLVAGKPTKEGIFFVTISAKNASGFTHSAVARWAVGYPEDPYFDEISLPSCGDCMQTGEFYEDSYWVGPGETLTLKGLPAGLTVTTIKQCCGQGNEYRISGTLTKPGVYTVEATLTREDKSTSRAKKLVTVYDGGSFYPAVRCEPERGTVLGLGVVSAGSAVKLTAKPAKGSVFAGWSGGAADALDIFDRKDPNLAYTAEFRWSDVFAKFILPQEDYLFVGVNECGLTLNEPVEFSFRDQFYVDSGSTPTVTVAGLPTGLKYDAKTRLVTGKPTKEGLYWVTVSAKNASGFTHSAVARWAVGYPEDPYFDEIGLPSCGDGLSSGDFYEESYEAGYGESLTLKGLPAGLAVTTDKRCCGLGNEYRISGTLTKPGVYTVEATLTRADKKSTSRAKKLVSVVDGGSFYPAVSCDAARGSVSGLGVCTAGSAVKLTAKPAKGSVFAGWSGGAADSLDYFDRMDPNLSYTAEFRWDEIRASFILPQEDYLFVGVNECGLALNEPVELSFWDQFSVDSGSTPTVTVSGLPTGLKYDAKTRLVTGKPTKEGIFFVTVSAKNASGFTHSAVARWTVGYPEDPYFDEIGGDCPSFEGISTGWWFDWSVEARGICEKLEVKGLPQGLTLEKWHDGAQAWWTVSGYAVQPGVYTVLLTATGEDGVRRQRQQTVVVQDDGCCYLSVVAPTNQTGSGTVTGSGVYRYGTTVKVSAKADKGSVFAGWYDRLSDDEMRVALMASGDWRNPSDALVLDCGRWVQSLGARFIAAEQDEAIGLSFEGSQVSDNYGVAEWHVREREYEDCYSVCWLYLDSQSLPTLTFKGLPKGCVWDAERSALVFRGVPTKAEVAEVTVTAKNASGATVAALLVIDTANAKLIAKAADGQEDFGTVSGGGGYTAGAKVKVTAKAQSGYVFAGWSGGTADNLDWFERLNPTLECELQLDDNFVEASFMPVAEDWLDFDWEEDVYLEVGQDVALVGMTEWVKGLLSSGSFPTVSVSGLPKGISFDAKTLLLSGWAMQSGVSYVTVSAKNAGGYAFDQTVRFIVGDVSLDEPDEIGRDWGVDFSGFDSLRLGEPFEWAVESWMAISANGLPTGLAVVRTGGYSGEEPYDLVRGTPTKAGKFTVKFTMKDPDTGKTLTTQKTVIVRGAPSAYIGVEETAGGTVTGMGVYGAGATVKLVAKPASGFVFAGWHNADGSRCAIEGFDYRTPTLTYVANGPWTFVPLFVTKAEDLADDYGLWGEDACRVPPDWGVDVLSDYLLWVGSLSLPKLTVKGLPAGTELAGLHLNGDDSFPIYHIRVKDKSKLKPGRYPVTVTAENQSKVKREWAFAAIVPNLTSDVIQNLDSSDEGYQLWLGVGGYLPTVDRYGEENWNSFAMPSANVTVDPGWTVSVDGLPAGMKYEVAKNTQLCCGRVSKSGGVNGAPTKAGSYTVTVTAKNGKLSEKATAFVTVNERPSWAVGTFGGCQSTSSGAIGSPVSLTVAADGKVSGKIGSTSFTGTLDRYFEDTEGTCGFAGEVNAGFLVVTQDPNLEGVGLACLYRSEPEWLYYWSWANGWGFDYSGVFQTWQNVWKVPGFDMTGISGLAGTLSNGLKVKLDGNGNAVIAGGLRGQTVSASFPLRLTSYCDYGSGSASFRFQVAVSVLSGTYCAFVDIAAERDEYGIVNLFIEGE